MRRKMLGAILLPLPFAALPVAAVLLGAVFGPGESDELVTRESPSKIIVDRAMTETMLDAGASLAKISEPAQFEPGCGVEGLRGES